MIRISRTRACEGPVVNDQLRRELISGRDIWTGQLTALKIVALWTRHRFSLGLVVRQKVLSTVYAAALRPGGGRVRRYLAKRYLGTI